MIGVERVVQNRQSHLLQVEVSVIGVFRRQESVRDSLVMAFLLVFSEFGLSRSFFLRGSSRASCSDYHIISVGL